MNGKYAMFFIAMVLHVHGVAASSITRNSVEESWKATQIGNGTQTIQAYLTLDTKKTSVSYVSGADCTSGVSGKVCAKVHYNVDCAEGASLDFEKVFTGWHYNQSAYVVRPTHVKTLDPVILEKKIQNVNAVNVVSLYRMQLTVQVKCASGTMVFTSPDSASTKCVDVCKQPTLTAMTNSLSGLGSPKMSTPTNKFKEVSIATGVAKSGTENSVRAAGVIEYISRVSEGIFMGSMPALKVVGASGHIKGTLRSSTNKYTVGLKGATMTKAWKKGQVTSRQILADKNSAIGVIVTSLPTSTLPSTGLSIKCNGVEYATSVTATNEPTQMLICPAKTTADFTTATISFQAPSVPPGTGDVAFLATWVALTRAPSTLGGSEMSSVSGHTVWTLKPDTPDMYNMLRDAGLTIGYYTTSGASFDSKHKSLAEPAASRRALQQSDSVVAPPVSNVASLPDTFPRIHVGKEIVAHGVDGTVVFVYNKAEIKGTFDIEVSTPFCFVTSGQSAARFIKHMQTTEGEVSAFTVFDPSVYASFEEYMRGSGCDKLQAAIFPPIYIHPWLLPHESRVEAVKDAGYMNAKCHGLGEESCKDGFELAGFGRIGDVTSCTWDADDQSCNANPQSRRSSSSGMSHSDQTFAQRCGPVSGEVGTQTLLAGFKNMSSTDEREACLDDILEYAYDFDYSLGTQYDLLAVKDQWTNMLFTDKCSTKGLFNTAVAGAASNACLSYWNCEILNGKTAFKCADVTEIQTDEITCTQFGYTADHVPFHRCENEKLADEKQAALELPLPSQGTDGVPDTSMYDSDTSMYDTGSTSPSPSPESSNGNRRSGATATTTTKVNCFDDTIYLDVTSKAQKTVIKEICNKFTKCQVQCELRTAKEFIEKELKIASSTIPKSSVYYRKKSEQNFKKLLEVSSYINQALDDEFGNRDKLKYEAGLMTGTGTCEVVPNATRNGISYPSYNSCAVKNGIAACKVSRDEEGSFDDPWKQTTWTTTSSGGFDGTSSPTLNHLNKWLTYEACVDAVYADAAVRASGIQMDDEINAMVASQTMTKKGGVYEFLRAAGGSDGYVKVEVCMPSSVISDTKVNAAPEQRNLPSSPTLEYKAATHTKTKCSTSANDKLYNYFATARQLLEKVYAEEMGVIPLSSSNTLEFFPSAFTSTVIPQAKCAGFNTNICTLDAPLDAPLATRRSSTANTASTTTTTGIVASFSSLTYASTGTSSCHPGTKINATIPASYVSCWYGDQISPSNPGWYRNATNGATLDCAPYPVNLADQAAVYFCPNGLPVQPIPSGGMPSACLVVPFNGQVTVRKGSSESHIVYSNARCVPSGTAANILPDVLTVSDIIGSSTCSVIKKAYQDYNVNNKRCCAST